MIRYVRTLAPWVERKADHLRYRMAHAAAWDAGNRHAEQHGRTVWTVDDWNAMCAEFSRLMPRGAR